MTLENLDIAGTSEANQGGNFSLHAVRTSPTSWTLGYSTPTNLSEAFRESSVASCE